MCPHCPGSKFSSRTLLQHPMDCCGCCYALFPLLMLGEGIIKKVKKRNRTDSDRQTDSCCCCWHRIL